MNKAKYILLFSSVTISANVFSQTAFELFSYTDPKTGKTEILMTKEKEIYSLPSIKLTDNLIAEALEFKKASEIETTPIRYAAAKLVYDLLDPQIIMPEVVSSEYMGIKANPYYHFLKKTLLFQKLLIEPAENAKDQIFVYASDKSSIQNAYKVPYNIKGEFVDWDTLQIKSTKKNPQTTAIFKDQKVLNHMKSVAVTTDFSDLIDPLKELGRSINMLAEMVSKIEKSI